MRAQLRELDKRKVVCVVNNCPGLLRESGNIHLARNKSDFGRREVALWKRQRKKEKTRNVRIARRIPAAGMSLIHADVIQLTLAGVIT
jgi:hypothetical protein